MSCFLNTNNFVYDLLSKAGIVKFDQKLRRLSQSYRENVPDLAPEKTTYFAMLETVICGFQAEFTKIRVHLYDGITRFTAIMHHMMLPNGPVYEKGCLMEESVLLELRYKKNGCNLTVNNLLENLRKISYGLSKINEDVQENTFQDKLQRIVQDVMPRSKFFSDSNRVSEFDLIFAEAWPSKEELGEVLCKYLLPDFVQVEDLFSDKTPVRKTYQFLAKDVWDKAKLQDNVQDRLRSFLTSHTNACLKNALNIEAYRKDGNTRSPWKDMNLYCSLKVIFIMMIMGKMQDFYNLVVKANAVSSSVSQSKHAWKQRVPKVFEKDFEPRFVNERFMSK